MTTVLPPPTLPQDEAGRYHVTPYLRYAERVRGKAANFSQWLGTRTTLSLLDRISARMGITNEELVFSTTNRRGGVWAYQEVIEAFAQHVGCPSPFAVDSPVAHHIPETFISACRKRGMKSAAQIEKRWEELNERLTYNPKWKPLVEHAAAKAVEYHPNLGNSMLNHFVRLLPA